ncbi:tripartite tricarboxylate transporter substrate binding protein [Variovorax sp. Sphag1AA]|uniref:tripartite tricarboxylate transporter substrate binding protein n=1 Tax=Variovorax sp. Sphag1AA TaxID=2587027 RepID=UPI001611ED23|nr:tripartite tricarboxylate transporter substrate binding protein [Variovorax sp. Sphag1AA]MBB3182106.1 tripartite-type tricarboxylate transporter receptor subunit TctC [Variovorax sp. Sphag1AA]
MLNTTRRRALCALAAASFAFAGAAGAQDSARWPDRPLRIVIPTPPGGALDGTARLIAERLAASLGQPVVVDNRAGANGAIAYGVVAKAPPDGNTMVLTLSSLILTSLMVKSPGYTLQELTPVSLVAMLPNSFAVAKHVPATNLRDFIAWARNRKEGVDYGTSGPGSSANILGSMFAQQAGINMVHVPFKGEAPAVQAALGGQIAVVIGAAGTLAAQAQAGQMKLLAVALPNRLKDFPDVPTFGELGYPAVSLSGWSVMAVPSGTPKPIVDRLSSEITRIVQTPEISARIFAYGFQPEGGTSDAARRFVQEETTRWTDAIKATGITME